MYCSNCGNEIHDNAVVCIHCGCAVKSNAPEAPAQPKQQYNALAIVGFVMAFFMPLAGLICSIIGYKRADRDFGGAQKGLALAGTIISAITVAVTTAIVLWIFISWLILWIAAISAIPAAFLI